MLRLAMAADGSWREYLDLLHAILMLYRLLLFLAEFITCLPVFSPRSAKADVFDRVK